MRPRKSPCPVESLCKRARFNCNGVGFEWHIPGFQIHALLQSKHLGYQWRWYYIGVLFPPSSFDLSIQCLWSLPSPQCYSDRYVVFNRSFIHSFVRSSLLIALDEPSVDKLCDDALPLKRDLARIVAHWRHSQHYLTRARDCEDTTVIHVRLFWRFSIGH